MTQAKIQGKHAKIQGKFYPLQYDEWLLACQELTPAQRDVLYFVRTLDPYGDGLDISIAEIARQLSTSDRTVHRSTVSRALKELDAKGFIDLELLKVKAKIKAKGVHCCDETTRCDETTLLPTDNERDHDATRCDETTLLPTDNERDHDATSVIMTQQARSSRNNQSLEPAPDKGSDSTKTIKTNKTLSDSGSEEKKEKKALEVVKEVEVSETVSSQPESSNCSSLVKTINPVKDKETAPRRNKTLQQRAFDWLPDGPWKVDGKLDPNFRDAIARDWMNRYGGDIHQRRADVLAHFKKDPANLPIRWEQYASEYLQRYQNTQTRLNNGVNIEEEYQQRLIQNHRAITEQLPEELDPIARQQPFFSTQLKDSDQKLITDNCTPFAVPAAAHPSENAVSDAQGVPAGMPENPKPSIPLSDTGTVENADADQPWKPEPIENLATREQVRELLAGLTKKLSEKLSVSKPAQEQIRAPETEISELNLWVRDPILRPEAMRRIMQSERYTVEFDEEGNPISVVEVTS